MIVYLELKCKHCKAHIMVRPQEFERRNMSPACPYCMARKLCMTDLALDVIAPDKENIQGQLRIVKLETAHQ
jgi:hypothetical protein